MGRLQQLHEAGVSIWLDTLSRELLETREFERLVRDFAVTGATSNPTIFAKAITNSDRYDAQLQELVARGLHDPQALFLELAPAVFQLGEIQDGQVIWVGMFATDREALDTAGLRE